MLNGLKGFIKTKAKVTYEGGKAYEISFQETVAELFSLGLVRGNFYQSDLEVIENTKDIMAKALAECPEWATKCAVYGQEFNSLKLVPTIWLVYLSILPDKGLFEKAFPRIITNPKMLHDFMELTRKAGIRRGMGRSTKRAVNAWLNNKLNDYHATRYKGKLAEIVKVARPVGDEKIQPFLDYIVNGNEDAFDRARALKTVTASLQTGVLSSDTVELIRKYGLQLEELKHTFGNLTDDQKQVILAYMVPRLKYHALTANLVAIERVFATETRNVKKRSEHGTFNQAEVLASSLPQELTGMVAHKLSDYHAYRQSRMLPFGLMTAHAMTHIPEWKTAIDSILRQSGRDVFRIPEDIGVRVGVDTSGSMSARVTPSLSAVDIASLFGAMVAMSIPQAGVYATASFTKKVAVSKNKTLFANAELIAGTDVGYGTCFEPLLDNYQGEKYVILITDGQQSDNLEAGWETLRGRPRGAKLIIWHVAGYNNKISQRNDVVYLKGYSDRLLTVLKNVIEDRAGQLDQIDEYEV